MKSLKQYIFEQYSKVTKADKLQQKNGGFMPKDYTIKFLKSNIEEIGASGDEMFEDENEKFVSLNDILKQVKTGKCKMQVHFDGGSPMDDELEVTFYLNDKFWCGSYIGSWNWDDNVSEEIDGMIRLEGYTLGECDLGEFDNETIKKLEKFFGCKFDDLYGAYSEDDDSTPYEEISDLQDSFKEINNWEDKGSGATITLFKTSSGQPIAYLHHKMGDFGTYITNSLIVN